ncbi:MAG: hypothetical protein KF764_24595 [Labilithrix sp.]|nr:hypothetical protein [Labilithrix sp.]MBX3221213.1 hypothetical protein [Labilithrix sp.]
MSRTERAIVGMGEGMIARRLVVRAKDVVFVKGIVEAHDGLAHVFAESGGDLTLAAAAGRDAELDELVDDLARELGGIASPVGE